MRRSFLTVAFVLMSMSCFGQVFRFQQFCQTGAQNVITQGLNSTTHVQRSYPSCTVAVYLTGTTTLATIYSDPLSTPLANPFTANTDGSFGFWAAPSANSAGCYDVTISGGNPGDQLGSPFTFADVCLGVGGGGGGGVSCPLAVAGAIGAFTSPTGFSCDPNFTTDFHGNFTAISGTFVGPVNGFFSLKGGTSDPGTQVKYKLPTNTFRWLAAASGSSFYARVPSTHCSPGQVWQVLSNSTDANGDTIDNMSCLTPATGGGTQFQLNGVNLANCSGSICPLQNVLNSLLTPAGMQITWSNPSGGQVLPTLNDGTTQILTPSAPTLTVGGTPGASTVTYEVQGCEDGAACTKHTLVGSTATVNNANATLSSSPITISGYADNLYGPRCYNIYRTVGGPSQGLIANCTGKAIIDNGLAGDGTSPTNTNTTVLVRTYSPLPACSYPPQSALGIDALPCSPTVYNDEFTNTFGAPGDAHDAYWSTQLNTGSATITWTNGMLSFINGTGSSNLECLFRSAPVAPFAFTERQFVTWNPNNQNSQAVGLALRESSTGKITFLQYQQDSTSGANDRLLIQNFTGPTGTGAVSGATTSSNVLIGGNFTGAGRQAYFRIYDDGTKLHYYQSASGVTYPEQGTGQNVTGAFTTAPDQYGVCLAPGGGTVAILGEYDYVRRTQ